MRESIELSSSQSQSTSPESASEPSTTQGIVNKVRDTASAQLTNQKNLATDGLGSVAEAVRQSGQQLRDQQHDTIADYAEQAAEQIERFSQRLRNKDVAELLGDLQQLARSQPALFIGGAFAVGLIGARFFKSSARSTSDEAPYRQWNGPSASSRGGESMGYAQASGEVPLPSMSGAVHDAPPMMEEAGRPTPRATGAASRTRTRRGPETERE